jgi:hypothetical protein
MADLVGDKSFGIASLSLQDYLGRGMVMSLESGRVQEISEPDRTIGSDLQCDAFYRCTVAGASPFEVLRTERRKLSVCGRAPPTPEKLRANFQLASTR